MSLKTMELSPFFFFFLGKLLISVWKYGIRKLSWGKSFEEEQEPDLLFYQPQTTDSAQYVRHIPLKLPSPRATVPSSTSAICHAFLFILLHMQRSSFSSSCSAQNIVSDFVRFWLELAIHLLALMAVQGIVRHLLSVLHQHQIM